MTISKRVHLIPGVCLCLGIAACFLLVSGAQGAGILLDTGAPFRDSGRCDGDNCGNSTEWTVMDTFSSGTWNITGFTFRSGESSIFGIAAIPEYVSTDWSIWDADPFTNAPILSGNAVAGLTSLGVIDGVDAYDFAFDGLDLDLAAGNYWMGWHHEYFSETSTLAMTINSSGSFIQMDGVSNFDPPPGCASCGDLSFQIRGNVVPVPAAVWLFGSALGLLGWMRRKAS